MILENNETTVIHHNTLSKKDQSIKEKLFSQQQKPKNLPKQHPKIQEKPSKDQFSQAFQAPSNTQIDGFLKKMEQEFQKTNEKQISIGILNQQTHLLKQQNEIINKNQQNLSKMIQNQQPKPNYRELLKELLYPLNEQITEIQRNHQEIKEIALNLQKSKDIPSENSLKQYHDKNAKLQQLMGLTQANISSLMPENLGGISNISDMNVEAYTKSLNMLRNQLENLQHESDKLQTKLEKIDRYGACQSINVIEKKYENHTVDEINPGIQEKLDSEVRKINFNDNFQEIMKKMGGEFDYYGFMEDIENIKGEFYTEIRKYEEFVSENKLNIPQFSMEGLKMDLEKLKKNEKMSILDAFKKKIGYKEEKVKEFREKASKDLVANKDKPLKFSKKSNLKPKSIRNIQSVPKKCPKDINFVKKKEDFETIFDSDKLKKKENKEKNEIFSDFKKKKENIYKENEDSEERKNQKNDETEVFSTKKEKKPEKIPKIEKIEGFSNEKLMDSYLENLLVENNEISDKKPKNPDFSEEKPFFSVPNVKKLKYEAKVIDKPENLQSNNDGNYDDLLKKFLYTDNDNDENSPSKQIPDKYLRYDNNKQENLKDLGTKLLKDRLFDMIENIKEEDSKGNSSIAKEIFKDDRSIIREKASEKKKTNEIPMEIPQGQQFIENFMNLLNNAITQINQAVVKNIENTKNNSNIAKNNKRNTDSEADSEDAQSNISRNYDNYGFFDNNPGYYPANVFPQNTGLFQNNNGLLPQNNMMPINPNKFFDEFNISSEISKNQSDIKESSYHITNESKSEGEMTGALGIEDNSERNEDLWVSDVMKEVEEEDELSEGEIKIPKNKKK